MIKPLLFLFIVFLPVIALSQQSKTGPAVSPTKGVFIDVALGPSFPLGAYAKSDPDNDESGYSMTGGILQLTCDWIGKKDFGLAFQYTLQYNPIKSSAQNLPIPGSSVPMGTGDWTNHYVLAGPVFMKYFNKVFFEAKLLGGVIISASPFFKTQDPKYASVSNNTGAGLAFSIGAGAGYRVSPNVALKINATYQMGTPKIHHQYGAEIIGYNYQDSVFIYSAPVTYDTKKVVSAFNLGVSVIFKIPG
jgi:hypothetical protein